MTKERMEELKSIINQRIGYYSNIGFTNLANEFTNVVKFLAEIENVIKENEELRARIQFMEERAREKIIEAAAAREGECD